MLKAAQLDRTLSKEQYDAVLPGLRAALLDAQGRTVREYRAPVHAPSVIARLARLVRTSANRAPYFRRHIRL